MMEVIEEQIKHAIKDLSPGESIRTLGILISEVMGVAEETSKEIRKPFNIPIDEIDPFPNHPFRVETDDEMFDLVRSIHSAGRTKH